MGVSGGVPNARDAAQKQQTTHSLKKAMTTMKPIMPPRDGTAVCWTQKPMAMQKTPWPMPRPSIQ